jgi:uncharacterized protein (DUF1501 family)
MHPTKREFLIAAAAGPLAAGMRMPFAAGLAGLGALATPKADAASSDYRALVCLFMLGGNDAHNWVVPVDAMGYGDYARARSSLTVARNDLRSISASQRQDAGRQFAFHADLDPLRELYEQGKLAVVANVGALARPTSKADFEAGNQLPPKLFSHNDQQSWWQSLGPEGTRTGWGGRIGDVLMSGNAAPVFTSVSATGNAVFLSGANCQQYQVGADGAVAVGALRNGSTLGSTTLAAAMRRSQFDTTGDALQTAYARTVKRSADAYATLSAATANVNLPPVSPTAVMLSSQASLVPSQLPLARQLRTVAQLIGAGQALGMRRQVFMVAMGGFDTHGNLLGEQPALMASVAHSISYFLGAMRDLALENNVTLFTASDFGRTLTSNGSGSDHGWGSHHFVAGGAVRGRDIYGRFPVTTVGSADDVGSGRLLPSTSVTQYAATLASWLGVGAADLGTVLPGIGNFPNSNLGFL